MTLKQCAAFRPDGEQCKRVAQEGTDFCYTHRACVEEKPRAIEPLPEGKIRLVSSSAWAICEFCGDAYPRGDLFPDKSKKLACRCCYFRAAVLDATKGQPEARYISACQVAELAGQNGIDFDAAVAELHDVGFRSEEHGGQLFFAKGAKA